MVCRIRGPMRINLYYISNSFTMVRPYITITPINEPETLPRGRSGKNGADGNHP